MRKSFRLFLIIIYMGICNALLFESVMAQGISPFPPKYLPSDPPNSYTTNLFISGRALGIDQRCETKPDVEIRIANEALKIAAVAAHTACNIAGGLHIDLIGITAFATCLPATILDIIVHANDIVIAQCDFQNESVDRAQIQAAYQNSRAILLGMEINLTSGNQISQQTQSLIGGSENLSGDLGVILDFLFTNVEAVKPNVTTIKNTITDERNFTDDQEHTDFLNRIKTRLGPPQIVPQGAPLTLNHEQEISTVLTVNHEAPILALIKGVDPTRVDGHDEEVKEKLLALQTALDANTTALQQLLNEQLELVRLLFVPIGTRSTWVPACNGGPCAYPAN